MPRFSANLGFLWAECPLVDRVRAAAAAGFPAVECHWPYGEDAAALRAVLDQTGTTMISLNTPPGDVARGEFGLAAVPGREAEARAGIEQALEFARIVGARHVHVMAGFAEGRAARTVFCNNLAHAVTLAAPLGVGILIEPINRVDRPGYFLHRVAAAREIIEELGARNLRMLFDCYHVQLTEGSLLRRMARHLAVIGHVQVAAVHDRGEPDAGEVDYPWLFEAMDDAGYRGFVGAEYLPRRGTDAGLQWFEPYKSPTRRERNE